jgi:hypothetical protein
MGILSKEDKNVEEIVGVKGVECWEEINEGER